MIPVSILPKSFKIKTISLLFLFVIGLYTSCEYKGGEAAPTGLMTDLLTNPDEAVITNANPRFSWIVPCETTLQTACQILARGALFIQIKKNRKQLEVSF